MCLKINYVIILLNVEVKELEWIVKHFFWFIIYSFLGWLYESTLCTVRDKKITNRGFLNGPYCPIYGTGAIVAIVLFRETNNYLLIFLSSMVVVSIIEYITSWLMEKIFKARWWDYSKEKFNINGRVFLLGAIVFGLMSLILIVYLHPFVAEQTNSLNSKTLNMISFILFSLFIIDLVFTVTKFLSFNRELQIVFGQVDTKFKALKLKYSKLSNSYKESVIKGNSQIRRLIKAFPNLKSIKYGDIFHKLRDFKDKDKKDN